MLRHRSIAAAPIRGASEAWGLAVQLLVDTLERSPHIPEGSVQRELAPLSGVGTALVAGGHLEKTPLLLTDSALQVEISIVTADSALDIEENLNPVPGGAAATSDWSLYVPAPAALGDAVRSAVASCPHATSEVNARAQSNPKPAPASLIDFDAVRRLEGGR